MDQISTPESFYERRLIMTEKKVQKRKRFPGKLTMTFIMQFAHAYHVERSLPLELSGFMLN